MNPQKSNISARTPKKAFSNISFCRQKNFFLEIMQTPKSLHITYAGATAGILVCLLWYEELLFIRWIGREAIIIIVPLLKRNSFDDLIVATLSLTPVLKIFPHV